jgi:Zn-dependent protease
MVEEGSVRRGSFAGVPIIWHFTLVFIPGFIFFHFSGFALPVRCALTLALSAAVIESILLHEAAHVWTARYFRVQSEAIVLHGFGGLALLRRHPDRRSHQILISLAGPLTNLALAAIGYALLLAVEALDPTREASRNATTTPWRSAFMTSLRTFVQVNVMLGVVNLLPALPLDGSAIARAFLEPRFSARTSVRITAGMGIFFSLWLSMGVGAFGVSALAMGGLLVILNVMALRRPEEFIDL